VITSGLATGALAGPLDAAVRKGNAGKVAELIAGGADVNQGDEKGTTPLHRAVERGRLDIAKLLVSRGAEVSARNGLGETPCTGRRGATA
jgi:uncharacterized protein